MLATALVAGLLTGCAPQDGTIPPPGVAAEATSSGDLPVVHVDEPWIPGCGSGCDNAYGAFASRHAAQGGPSAGDLAARLDALPSAPPPARMGFTPEELRAEILQRLGIGFLYEGLDRRNLAVATLHEGRESGYRRQELLFWDPEVGSFQGLLLTPDTAGPHPGILALHGHRQTDAEFAHEFLGEELARRGFVVLAPRFRAMDCSGGEERIARSLLEQGRTLMGLHVYEALLMLKFLEADAGVEPGNLGLLSHSGGASIAALLVRVSDAFEAVVVDRTTDFRDRCSETLVHCETVPDLFAISGDINDTETLSTARLEVPYRFRRTEQREDVLSFLESHLQTGRR